MEKKRLLITITILLNLCVSTLVFADTDTKTICSEEAKLYALEAARYMQQGHFNKAIENSEKALELDPKCFSAYLGLGGCYLSLGEHDKAIKIYEEGIKNIPEYSWTFYDSIAVIYASQGEYQKAIEICENTLQLFPDNRTTYISLGRIYANLGDYRRAKENLEKALDASIKKGDEINANEARNLLKLIP